MASRPPPIVYKPIGRCIWWASRMAGYDAKDSRRGVRGVLTPPGGRSSTYSRRRRYTNSPSSSAFATNSNPAMV